MHSSSAAFDEPEARAAAARAERWTRLSVSRSPLRALFPRVSLRAAEPGPGPTPPDANTIDRWKAEGRAEVEVTLHQVMHLAQQQQQRTAELEREKEQLGRDALLVLEELAASRADAAGAREELRRTIEAAAAAAVQRPPPTEGAGGAGAASLPYDPLPRRKPGPKPKGLMHMSQTSGAHGSRVKETKEAIGAVMLQVTGVDYTTAVKEVVERAAQDMAAWILSHFVKDPGAVVGQVKKGSLEESIKEKGKDELRATITNESMLTMMLRCAHIYAIL